MAIAGQAPSARDQSEFKLMVDEKKTVFGKSFTAMAVQSALANQKLAASLFKSFWFPTRRKPSAATVVAQVQRAAVGVFSKSLEPVHRTAVANAKRLARTKLR